MRKFATLRIWHPDCWFLEMTERNADVRIDCRGVHAHGGFVETDAVVRATSGDALATAIRGGLPQDVHTEVVHVGRESMELYSRYPSYRSLYLTMVEAGFLLVGPVTHANGYERWEVLADSRALKEGLEEVRKVAEVQVERLRDTAPAPADADEGLARIGATLTKRQWEVLARAVAEGYYSWPRAKNVKRMAEDLGISGPTALEHLRRAESRVIPAVLDELRRGRAL